MPDYSTLKPKILMHACCATCGLDPFFQLREKLDITFFYYNPNIHPESEYSKRLRDLEMVSSKLSIPIDVGSYEQKKWLRLTQSHKHEPEGGKRCQLCFSMRLEKCAETAIKGGFDLFGTTLTISPHKDHELINSIGLSIAKQKKISFYTANFKKGNGFKRTMELSRTFGLYRQNYCGCIYSKPFKK
jgi:predicted adenine nucleotide alpha hydrolase (AANH) superfamily ATPase